MGRVWALTRWGFGVRSRRNVEGAGRVRKGYVVEKLLPVTCGDEVWIVGG